MDPYKYESFPVAMVVGIVSPVWGRVNQGRESALAAGVLSARIE
jgi:hypothetical protein